MLDAIIGAMTVLIVLFLALCALAVIANRRVAKRTRDAEQTETALQIANGIKERNRHNPGTATGAADPTGNIPLVTATCTMSLDGNGKTAYWIDWDNHVDPGDPPDMTHKLAIAGIVTRSAQHACEDTR